MSFLLSGCGITKRYDSIIPYIDATEGSSVAIGVLESREYVLNKEKPVGFVGIVRGLAGNPFDITTASGKPFADVVSECIKVSLANRGVRVTVISLPMGLSENEAVYKLVSTSQKSILVTIREWKPDTTISTYLAYDLQVQVFDKDGKPLATKRIRGHDALGGTFWSTAAYSENAVSEAYKRKLAELFSAPVIAKHL